MLNTAPLRWDYAKLLGLCDLVVANGFEARSITGLSAPGDAARVLARQEAGQGAGQRAAVVTLGAGGCVAACGGDVAHHAAPVVAAVDSTGAGDVFCGMLAAGWAASGMPLHGLAAAQGAASLTVGRAGCFGAFPTMAELRQFLT